MADDGTAVGPTKAKAAGASKRPAPTEAQTAKILALEDRSIARADGPAMKLDMKGGVLNVSYEECGSDVARALALTDLATMDQGFYQGITGHIASIGSQGKRVDADASNFLLSVVRAVRPQDELETLLAVQMGAVHAATMMMARRLNHVETIPQQDAAERALNKLARTYTMQMEALKRYRTGGQQKVVVEHVTVNAGGQAIVGNVAHGGRGANGK